VRLVGQLEKVRRVNSPMLTIAFACREDGRSAHSEVTGTKHLPFRELFAMVAAILLRKKK
jgi:hypothetical protein